MGLSLRLFRHGTTDWTDEGRYTGLADVGLNEAGRRQLESVELPEVSYSSIVVSDLRRCRETADVLGFAARPEPRLREFDFGDLEGSTWDDLDPETRQSLLDYDRFVAPGGESVAAFGTRIDAFVGSLDDGVHLLITHGGVIHHLLRRHGLERHVSPAGWIDLSLR